MRLLLILFLYTTILTAQDSLNVTQLFNWQDTTLNRVQAYGQAYFRYNEVWGVVVNSREYAIIGSTEGTHIFDVTDPVNAEQVAYIPGNYDKAIHRDYHDYKGYLYMVSDEGNATLQIADLSYLPDSVSVVYNSNNLFSRAHNIFIDSSSGYLYTTNNRVLSLADPANPQYSSFPGVYGHDLYIRHDTLYVNKENNGLTIYDHTDPFNPVVLGTLTNYPDKGYNHSGWVDKTGHIYAFSDETYGTDVKICDVSDYADIKVIARVNSGGSSTSMPHNVLIRDDFMYVAYYHDGLYVYDISDPYSPTVAGHYDTYPLSPAPNYNGAWGVYPFLPSGNILVSDTEYGLFVFDVKDIISSLANEKIPDADFEVFPNPFRNEFTVSYQSESAEDVEMVLYDQHGNSMQKLAVQENIKTDGTNIQRTINCTALSPGLYILKLCIGDKEGVKQLIKLE